MRLSPTLHEVNQWLRHSRTSTVTSSVIRWLPRSFVFHACALCCRAAAVIGHVRATARSAGSPDLVAEALISLVHSRLRRGQAPSRGPNTSYHADRAGKALLR